MIPREDQGLLLCDFLRAIRHEFLIFDNLQVNKLLQDVHHAILLEHIFPKICCWVSIRISRITFTTVISSTIRALVKRQEESVFTRKFRGHPYFKLIYTKIAEDSLVELKANLSGITVIHPLALCVVNILSRVLIFEFECKHRYTINCNNHINRIIGINRIVPLTITSNLILFIQLECCLIEAGFGLKIANPERNASMFKAVTKNRNQSIHITCRIECITELSFGIYCVLRLKSSPFFGLGSFNKTY